MVNAWYMLDNPPNPRLPNHLSPPDVVDMDHLKKTCGVESFIIDDVTALDNNEMLQKFKKDRNYTYEDEITCSKECLDNFEEKLKTFYEEHLHTDEEIRLVLEGSGYFDVRDPNDRWVRIAVSKGDLLVIPAGIYHRFTLDSNNFIRAKRYFIGEPVWTPHNRPADDLSCRKQYLEKINSSYWVN